MNIIRKCSHTIIKRNLAFANFSTSSVMCDHPTKDQAKYFPVKETPMLPKDSFKGKTAFITGGGTGLGKAMATMLSSLGANVTIAARRGPILEETAKEITAATGNPVLPLQLDIRSPDKVKEAFDTAEEKFGVANVIVNNAAGNFISPTERLSANTFKTIVDIVLLGTAYTTLEAGKRLINANTGGSFISIGTTYTNNGSGFVTPSASAKAGAECMMKSLASEWGKYGMRFNVIAPGPIPTEGAWSRLDPTGKFLEKNLERLPLGRFGSEKELANVACFLLSDYASWITGTTVTIDGGEYPFISGEFNAFAEVKKEQWDMMEQMIRSSNKKSKE